MVPGGMAAQCSSRECDGRQCSSDYYACGTIQTSMQTYYQYQIHYPDVPCIPCCLMISNDIKIPGWFL